jgi:hypothetical protein
MTENSHFRLSLIDRARNKMRDRYNPCKNDVEVEIISHTTCVQGLMPLAALARLDQEGRFPDRAPLCSS